MKKNCFANLIFLLGMLLVGSTIAQCPPSFVKKYASKLSPFTTTGQMNSSLLAPGQSSELTLTFYSGQDYRILICSEEDLGVVSFKVMDLSRTMVFDSRNNYYPNFWDFKVKSTQQFIVQISRPAVDTKLTTRPIASKGCVSVLVGFKKG